MTYHTKSTSLASVAALAVGAMLAFAPMKAEAATINGQIDISGTVNLNNSTFSSSGNVDLNDPGNVQFVLGDFTTTVDIGDSVALTDIDFTAPGTIWSVGGFTFTATGFSDFMSGTTKGFTSAGLLSGTGFDDTEGTLIFSTQGGTNATASFSSSSFPSQIPLPASALLLLGGLGGLGGLSALRRRKRAA